MSLREHVSSFQSLTQFITSGGHSDVEEKVLFDPINLATCMYYLGKLHRHEHFPPRGTEQLEGIQRVVRVTFETTLTFPPRPCASFMYGLALGNGHIKNRLLDTSNSRGLVKHLLRPSSGTPLRLSTFPDKDLCTLVFSLGQLKYYADDESILDELKQDLSMNRNVPKFESRHIALLMDGLGKLECLNSTIMAKVLSEAIARQLRDFTSLDLSIMLHYVIKMSSRHEYAELGPLFQDYVDEMQTEVLDRRNGLRDFSTKSITVCVASFNSKGCPARWRKSPLALAFMNKL